MNTYTVMSWLAVLYDDVLSMSGTDLTTSGYCQPLSHSVLLSLLPSCHVQSSVALSQLSLSLALYLPTAIVLPMGC